MVSLEERCEIRKVSGRPPIQRRKTHICHRVDRAPQSSQQEDSSDQQDRIRDDGQSPVLFEVGEGAPKLGVIEVRGHGSKVHGGSDGLQPLGDTSKGSSGIKGGVSNPSHDILLDAGVGSLVEVPNLTSLVGGETDEQGQLFAALYGVV